MQKDMHYYGTYALARAAGLKVGDAKVLAYAAQYVDDSTVSESEVHEDGGMFETVATAHTNSEAISNAVADHAEQRKVWVPFHFFPGNEGETLSEKLTCVKDSALAQEMRDNHIRHAVSVKKQYGLSLMGVMAHVYADTFAHYGFSGISSRLNKVDGSSFELDIKDKKVRAYVMSKFSSFLTKYVPTFLVKNFRRVASRGASFATGALGHGAVGTYPDRPFLRWKFSYKKTDKDIARTCDSGWRCNVDTFMEGSEKLYNAFREYAQKIQSAPDPVEVDTPVEFEAIRETIKGIICQELPKEKRIEAWIMAIENGSLFTPEQNEALFYSEHEWEEQKADFEYLKGTHEMVKKEVYQFHQAAIYHRDYTLKQLLPKYKIVVL